MVAVTFFADTARLEEGLTVIVTVKNLGPQNDADFMALDSRVANVELRHDEREGILWNYIAQHATPHFSHALLDDIREVQEWIRSRATFEREVKSAGQVKYVVFGSRIPGVFSLGGDLELFASLIRNQSRGGLTEYARKATDAVYFHAKSYGDALSFSLVEGTAMGGGFEAALAGNILVVEKGTKLGFPEVLFGLFPGMGAYTMLRQRTDARTAEEVILSAKNYSAEELFEMGIIDILCEKGEGESAIRAYIARHKNLPGIAAFRRALNHSRTIDRDELNGFCEAWVDAALALDANHLRRIDRLVSNQQRHFPKNHLGDRILSVA